MLKQLSIRNFALIDSLDVDFHPGFSVITGETGAGKSIILGALGLLLGARADSKSIKQGATRCTVEAVFDIANYPLQPFFEENDLDYDPSDCILRREVNASGKSRAFINDTPVALSVIRALSEQLVDIHSQHQNLLLQNSAFQLSVLDIIASAAQQKALYAEAFASFQQARQQLEALRREIEAGAANEDFLRFQYDELRALSLQPGEQEELEARSRTMQHAEDIKRELYTADQALGQENGVLSLLRQAYNSVEGVKRYAPDAEETAERLHSVYIELKDLSADVASLLAATDFDPAEAERVNARLDSIYSLQRKHHVGSVEELIALEKDLKSQLDNITFSDEALAQAEALLAQATAEAEAQAAKLTALRKKAASMVEEQMAARLKPLGLPAVRFSVEITAKALSCDGADTVRFLFSANPGTPLREVSEIASGGEIARVMLSLKALISGAMNLPTIIFDEIDTGVSGRVAEQMALIMEQMGNKNHQVVSITHLPQIAARGQHQYKVYKQQDATQTETSMRQLSAEERVQEIAQMLSGTDVTEAAISNARALLNQNQS